MSPGAERKPAISDVSEGEATVWRFGVEELARRTESGGGIKASSGMKPAIVSSMYVLVAQGCRGEVVAARELARVTLWSAL